MNDQDRQLQGVRTLRPVLAAKRRVSGSAVGLAVGLAIGLAAEPAHAARALDVPPPTQAAVRNTPQPDPATQADDRSSLRRGRVTGLSPDGAWVHVNGSWLRIAEGSTRLFRQGRPVQAGALSQGQWLEFTLAPGAADRKTLGVVYVP